jgi:L-fuconolactonase
MPEDVRPQMRACGVDRAILVQAAGTPEEIPWMLELCNEHPFIAGVVGYVDLTNRNAGQMLTGFTRDPRFKGVRLNLPFAPRLRAALDASLAQLGRLGLSCDLLMSAFHMPLALDLAGSHPETVFILDHFAGHRLKIGGNAEFAAALQPLVALPNVAIKVSGYLTSNDDVPRITLAQTLVDYVRAAIDVVGADRLMFGGDWPICTQAGDYRDTVGLLQKACSTLPAQHFTQIMSGTATRVYRL